MSYYRGSVRCQLGPALAGIPSGSVYDLKVFTAFLSVLKQLFFQNFTPGYNTPG